MSEVLKMKPQHSNEVSRLDLHEAIPNLVNSKTISQNTYRGKMTLLPDCKLIKFEDGGKVIGYMPDTNVKFIWMK